MITLTNDDSVLINDTGVLKNIISAADQQRRIEANDSLSSDDCRQLLIQNMNYAKENIKFYLPEVVKLTGSDGLDWERIDTLFSEEIERRIAEGNGETLMVEATIYDIIIEVKKGNLQAVRLLSFFKRLLEELAQNLTPLEQTMIIKNIRDFLTRLNLKYVDYIGELAVINNLIKSNLYRLEYVETKLTSGKTIDFSVKETGSGKIVLVEVVNIHLNSDRIEKDESKIRKFLTHRLEQKIESKKSDRIFFLVPVLWGGWQDIRVYSDYFIKHRMHIPNVLEPVAYITFIDPKDETYYLHRFGNVSNLFASVTLVTES